MEQFFFTRHADRAGRRRVSLGILLHNSHGMAYMAVCTVPYNVTKKQTSGGISRLERITTETRLLHQPIKSYTQKKTGPEAGQYFHVRAAQCPM